MKCLKCGEVDINTAHAYLCFCDTQYNGKMVFCKNCVKQFYVDYYAEYEDSYYCTWLTCRKLNIPFLEDCYMQAFNKFSDKNKEDFFGLYLGKLNSLGYRNHPNVKSFDDGLTKMGKPEDNIEIDDKIIKRWGKDFQNNSDYEFLEEQLYNLKASFECNDYGMEMIMRDISMLNLKIHKGQQSTAIKTTDITALIKSRSDLMSDGGLKPRDINSAISNQETFGTFIKQVENEEPIPTYEDDHILEYVNYMIAQICKMEGINNDFVKQYEHLIEKYTIQFDEIYSEDND